MTLRFSVLKNVELGYLKFLNFIYDGQAQVFTL